MKKICYIEWKIAEKEGRLVDAKFFKDYYVSLVKNQQSVLGMYIQKN